MSRYIDTQKITVPRGFFNKNLGVPDLLKWLEAQPAADVVPRSVILDLERKLRSMLPFKAYPIPIDGKCTGNSYELGKEHVIYDSLNYLDELEKKYTVPRKDKSFDVNYECKWIFKEDGGAE